MRWIHTIGLGIGVACCALAMGSCAISSGSEAGLRSQEATATLSTWREGLPERIEADVRILSQRYPGRHASNMDALDGAASWLVGRVEETGLSARTEWVDTPTESGTVRARNIIAEVEGRKDPGTIIVVGAHYDSVPETPGADDNASGVAGVLALAEIFAAQPAAATIRFELYTNEEQPYSFGEHMGSVVRSKQAQADGDNIAAMLSLEMIGYYTRSSIKPEMKQIASAYGADVPGRENFIAVAAWPAWAALVDRIGSDWRGKVECFAHSVPVGVARVGFSDQWSYWQVGYPAVIVTDTAFLRNPNYHKASDTADTLDYEIMAEVIASLRGVVASLAEDPPVQARGEDVSLELTNSGADPISIEITQGDKGFSLGAGETRVVRVSQGGSLFVLGAQLAVGSGITVRNQKPEFLRMEYELEGKTIRAILGMGGEQSHPLDLDIRVGDLRVRSVEE